MPSVLMGEAPHAQGHPEACGPGTVRKEETQALESSSPLWPLRQLLSRVPAWLPCVMCSKSSLAQAALRHGA